MASFTYVAIDRDGWMAKASFSLVSQDDLDGFIPISGTSAGVDTLHMVSHSLVSESKLLYMVVSGFQQQKGATLVQSFQASVGIMFSSIQLAKESYMAKPRLKEWKDGLNLWLSSQVELFAVKEVCHICTI